MIGKTELSGWWDRVCMRTGWSDKISKWKWLSLQFIFTLGVGIGLFLILAVFSDGLSYQSGIVTVVIICGGTTLANHTAWNRDQREIREKENEETVVI